MGVKVNVGSGVGVSVGAGVEVGSPGGTVSVGSGEAGMAVSVDCTSGGGVDVGVDSCLPALRLIRVTMMVPTTPINAAIMDGSILDDFDSDM